MGLYKLIEKKKRQQKRKNTTKMLAIAAATTTAGVLSGILLAPKSGKETRADLKEKAGQANAQLKTKSEDFRSNLTESKNKIKEYLASKKCSKSTDSCEKDIVEDIVEVLDEATNTEEVQEVI